ncbi:hypothetical protein GGI15_004663 [Coemansia interrupta]|uniref:AA9 family lytic polysaccharide monooxygenase n=1 Tax=Coemansia interrupta TaxID=1126814 RepID=A0A9W8H230_9FUNG|nr:hypothetical protein GGI15_004663 [Coemansia interrupta]
MKHILFVAALLAVILTAQAHTFLSNLTINGTRLELGKCIRPYEDNRNFPVKDLSSDELTCRTTSMNTADTDICGVPAGSTVTVEWHETDEQDRAISDSHLGPCIVYLSPLEANGAGNVWFKIFEDGYDPDTKKWCVDKIIASKGLLDITIPADIKQGNYLMRTEVIALHEADREYGTDENAGAELFPNCAQLYIIGTGTAEPTGVAIPGVYTTKDPGLLFDLYDGYDSYPIPGPELYEAGSLPAGGSPATSSTDEDATSSETEETSSKDEGESKDDNNGKASGKNDEDSSSSDDDGTSSTKAPALNLDQTASQENDAGSPTETEDVAIGATITNAAGQPCVRVRRRRRRGLRGELTDEEANTDTDASTTSKPSKTKTGGSPTSTNTDATDADNDGSQKSGKSISGGAIAGIVVAVVAAFFAMVAFLFWRRRQQRKAFLENSVDYNEFPEYDPASMSDPHIAQAPALDPAAAGFYAEKPGAGNVFDVNAHHHNHHTINARDLDEV